MFLPLTFTIWLSLVLAGFAVSDCGLSLHASLGISTPGRPIFSGKNLGMDNCGTVSVPGYRRKLEGFCPWLSRGSSVLMAQVGISWDRNLSRTGGLTCAHR